MVKMKNTLKIFGLVLAGPALLLLWIYTRWNILLVLIGTLIIFGMLMNAITAGLFLFIRKMSNPLDYTEYRLHLMTLRDAINPRLLFILYPFTIATYLGLYYYEQYLLFGLGCIGLVGGQLIRAQLNKTIAFLEGKQEL